MATTTTAPHRRPQSLLNFPAPQSPPSATPRAPAKRPLHPSLFHCPNCGNATLDAQTDHLHCRGCNANFARTDGKFRFVNTGDEVVTDGLDRIKTFFKKFTGLYKFLIEVISPVYPLMYGHCRQIIRDEIAGRDLVAINLGSGYGTLSEHLYNVDLLPYPAVDVTADIEHLPFKDNSVDYVLNIAVLEHVPHPAKAIAEIHRVLKPGGKLYCYIPFMQGFHASPYDFQRFTYEGMKVQFEKFEIQQIHSIGPTSGMLWIVQEWLAIALSFGIQPLHRLLHIGFMLTTWPIKFLDVALNHHPMAKNIATGFSVRCVKK
jgi:SAM-dependent methyltransferase